MAVIARFSLVVYRVIFREIRLESKWKTTFCVFLTENSRRNGTSEKVVLFFRMEYFKRKFVVHFFKAILDTSFRPSRPFSGKWNWFVLMVLMVNAIAGRNLPVLNFANHWPKPRTDRFAHVNGKQPLFHTPTALRSLELSKQLQGGSRLSEKCNLLL